MSHDNGEKDSKAEVSPQTRQVITHFAAILAYLKSSHTNTD